MNGQGVEVLGGGKVLIHCLIILLNIWNYEHMPINDHFLLFFR